MAPIPAFEKAASPLEPCCYSATRSSVPKMKLFLLAYQLAEQYVSECICVCALFRVLFWGGFERPGFFTQIRSLKQTWETFDLFKHSLHSEQPCEHLVQWSKFEGRIKDYKFGISIPWTPFHIKLVLRPEKKGGVLKIGWFSRIMKFYVMFEKSEGSRRIRPQIKVNGNLWGIFKVSTSGIVSSGKK